MCPECFHIIETSICNSNAIYDIRGRDIVQDFTVSIDYLGTCPNCNEHVDFAAIDANMGQIISILNKKGYYTAFSCEGYIEIDDNGISEEFSTPYIYFYSWSDTKILETNPLPDGWYIDNPNSEVFCIRGAELQTYFEDNSVYDEYVKTMKNTWDKEKSIKDIYEWAVNLPDKDSSLKQAQHECIKIAGNRILKVNSNKTIAAQYE